MSLPYVVPWYYPPVDSQPTYCQKKIPDLGVCIGFALLIADVVYFGTHAWDDDMIAKLFEIGPFIFVVYFGMCQIYIRRLIKLNGMQGETEEERLARAEELAHENWTPNGVTVEAPVANAQSSTVAGVIPSSSAGASEWTAVKDPQALTKHSLNPNSMPAVFPFMLTAVVPYTQ